MKLNARFVNTLLNTDKQLTIHFTFMPQQQSLSTSIYLATLSQTWNSSHGNYNRLTAYPAKKRKKLTS